MIHVNTTNKSFIEVSEFLRQKGIINCEFMLQLLDPSIKDIDPFDPTISRELKGRILVECCRNPWYYLREIVRIPLQGGGYDKFKLHRGNLAIAFLFFAGVDSYVCLPQMTYKTISILSLLSYPFMFSSKTDMVFLDKKVDDAKFNLLKMKTIVNGLPDYVRPQMEEPSTLLYTNKLTDSSIFLTNNISTAAIADSIGRDLTFPIQFYDNFEFIEHADVLINTSERTYRIARENARRNGNLYGRILSSVPSDLASPISQKTLPVLHGTCEFDEIMYDVHAQSGDTGLREFIDKRRLNGIVYIEFKHTHLGMSNEWFKERCLILNNNTDIIRRELLLERFSTHNPCEDAYKVFKQASATFIHELKKEMGTEVEVRLNSHENSFEIIKIDLNACRSDGAHFEELPMQEFDTISDTELDRYNITNPKEREIIKSAYASHPKGFFPNPYCALR